MQDKVQQVHIIALQHGRDPDAVEETLAPEKNLNIDLESKRLVKAKNDRDKRIAQDNSTNNPRLLTAQVNKDDKRGNTKGETTY